MHDACVKVVTLLLLLFLLHKRLRRTREAFPFSSSTSAAAQAAELVGSGDGGAVGPFPTASLHAWVKSVLDAESKKYEEGKDEQSRDLAATEGEVTSLKTSLSDRIKGSTVSYLQHQTQQLQRKVLLYDQDVSLTWSPGHHAGGTLSLLWSSYRCNGQWYRRSIISGTARPEEMPTMRWFFRKRCAVCPQKVCKAATTGCLGTSGADRTCPRAYRCVQDGAFTFTGAKDSFLYAPSRTGTIGAGVGFTACVWVYRDRDTVNQIPGDRVFDFGSGRNRDNVF